MFKKLLMLLVICSTPLVAEEARTIQNSRFYVQPGLMVFSSRILPSIGASYRYRNNRHGLECSVNGSYYNSRVVKSFVHVMPKLSYLFYPTNRSFYVGVGVVPRSPAFTIGYESSNASKVKFFAQFDAPIWNTGVLSLGLSY